VAAGFGRAVFVRAALGGDDGKRAAVGNPYHRVLPELAATCPTRGQRDDGHTHVTQRVVPAAFIKSAIDMVDQEYGFTAFGPVGGVFVIGIGMLALGVPLMIACAVRFRAFFRGETLKEDTPILVPDTGAEPVALHE
jgi:predicted phage tail protein